MLDSYSYTAPARVKTLVVPIDGLSAEHFESFYNTSLSKYYEVRLVDVTHCDGLFNPQGYPHGRIIYDYQLSAPDTESLFLQDFEPFRKVFNVLGLAKFSKDTDYEEQLAQLRKENISAINHSIIVFDSPTEGTEKSNSENTVFYVPKANNVTALETILCDMTSRFLNSLTNYASSYQHVTLRSPGSVGSGEVSSSTGRKKSSPSSKFTNGHSYSSGSTINQESSMSSLAAEKKKKRISSTSFLPNFENNPSHLSQEKLRASKTKGRQQKIMGNFYLLSGRLSDSLKEFCDAVLLLKQANDCLWLGSALDGLGVCVMMLTFLEVPFQLPTAITTLLSSGNSFSNSSKETIPLTPTASPRSSIASISRSLSNQMNSISSSPQQQAAASSSPTNTPNEFNIFSILDLVNQIMNKTIFYYRQTFGLIEDYVPQIVYCESILRYVKLMSLIYLNNGLDFDLLKHIVKSVPLKRSGQPDQLKAPHSIDKTQITQIEKEIFTSAFNKLDFIHKARIYCCLISISTDLKLYRRRSFLLKELFDVIIPLLSERKTEINSTFSSISDSKKLSTDYKTNRASILGLIDEILTNYGVSTNLSDEQSGRFYSPSWIDLHLIIIKRFIELTDKLQFIEASIRYASLLLKGYSFVLTAQEQTAIFNKIKQQVKQLRLENNDIKLSYWDDFLARNITSLPAINELTPIKQNQLGDITDMKKLKSEVYNPFSSIKDINEELITLVQGEPFDLLVTLQNPFSFEIEIKNLEVVCNNRFKVEMVQVYPYLQQEQETQSDSISIKPNQLLESVATVTPMDHGELEIVGIRAEVCGCSPRVFDISISKDFKVHEKIKQPGLRAFMEDSQPSVLYENNYDSIVKKSLKFHVLSPQPVLSLIDTSLLNNSIVLLEGETKNFSLELQNISPVAINHLSSLFLDSTKEPLNKALASKLPPNEIYEIEYYLLKKQPFSVINKEDLASIEGDQKFSIELSLLGKRGMSYGSVMLEYGNAKEDAVLKYIRRLDIPINITVYPSIEIASCDVLPILNSGEIFTGKSSLLDEKGRKSFWSYLNGKVAQGERLTDYCMLLLDLRNSSMQDLKVDLISSGDQLLDDEMIPLPSSFEAEKSVISDTVGRGRTERFLLPLKRMELSEEILANPIPSLRNKQFVVDNVTPKEEQKFVREAFWYRQELLKHIQGNWRTTAGDSLGDIELRGIRLSSKMLSILRLDTLHFEQGIYSDEGKVPLREDSASYHLALKQFYVLRTTVTNRSTRTIRGMFRYIPMSKSSNVSVDRKILFNGVLQYPLPRALAPGDSVELELSICILETGEFEWGSILDEWVDDGEGYLKEVESHVQRGSLFISAK